MTGLVMLLLGASLVGGTVWAARAGASAQSITVSPHSSLRGGEKVSVTGAGFTRGSPGAILECNDSPGQPATVTQIHGHSHAIAVGCTAPVAATTSRRGTLGPVTLSVVVGTLGSWESGDDSAGNPAASDAALYPCPPTPAQGALASSAWPNSSTTRIK
jgi:hypothetical protein